MVRQTSQRKLPEGVRVRENAVQINFIDHKLTASYDPERYFNSWQWRAYLTMLGKDKFRYQVFECSDIKPGEPITIKDYHTLDMHAYEGMQNEVVGLVSELSELINKWLVQGLPCKRKYN